MRDIGFCEGCLQEKEIYTYDIVGGFPYCFSCWKDIQTELGGYDDDDVEEEETAEDWSEEELKRRG